MFIIQLGPFENEEEAKEQLGILKADSNLNVEFYSEVRDMGEGLSINK